jgi:hypothetical protein
MRVSGRAVIRNPAKKRRRPLAGAALLSHRKRMRKATGGILERVRKKAASINRHAAKHRSKKRRVVRIWDDLGPSRRGVARPAPRKHPMHRQRKRDRLILAAEASARRRTRKGRKAGRKSSMAKKRRMSAKTRAKLSRKAKARWRARRASGKFGRMGRTRRHAQMRRGARSRKARGKGKRGRPRKARGKGKRGRPRKARPRKARPRKSKTAKTVVMLTSAGARTIRMNPGRRRRYRRNPRRRYRRNPRRHYRRNPRRRYRRNPRRRHYRRNPGNMILDLAKRAVPVLAGMYGTRLVASKIGPMIPGVSALGSLTSPVLAVGTMLGLNFLSGKVSIIAKHKNELLIGAALSALDSLVSAFAPASVKSLVGMSDYVQMGDYLAVGAVPPINDSMTLSDYLAVGSDGVQEELGLEEELGIEEELGNDLLGGMSTGALVKRVPTQNFLTPVPARSFTKAVPGAGTAFDNPNQLYTGIFSR